MLPRPTPMLAGLTLALAATGCEADRWLAGDIAISAQTPFDPETHVVVVREIPPPDATKLDGTPTPPGFDPVQVRAAVEAVDLAMCWRPGSTHGLGVARVTFNPAGNVGLVEINNTVEGALLDPSCISRQLGSLHIAPYNGAPIAVTANIIVG